MKPIYLGTPYFSPHYPFCSLCTTQHHDFLLLLVVNGMTALTQWLCYTPELHEFYDKPLFIIHKPASYI